jgi:membrane protease subunit HflC
MKRVITALILLTLLAWWGSTCLVAVDETQYAIITQFGRPVRTVLNPGLQFKWPAPIQTVVRFDNRLQIFEDPAEGTPAKEYLTRDKKNVEVATSTCWRIGRSADDVLKFLEAVRDREGAEVRLGDTVKNQFNAKLGSSDFEALVSTDLDKRRWGEIVEEIRDACATRARESFGIEVVDLRIQRLSFPMQNRRSVFDRMRAEREQMATQYRSEGEAAAMRIRADAQEQQERILAEARAEAGRIRGQADAEATRIYGQAYGVDPDFYRFLRTLESYERGLDADTVLILPSESPFFRLLSQPDLPLDAQPEPMLMEKLTQDGNADAETPDARTPEPPQG